MRDVYLTDDPVVFAVLLDKAIAGCLADEVPEIRSLGNTLKRWPSEILNHHRTGASNGPTEGHNLCVKKVKRPGCTRLSLPLPRRRRLHFCSSTGEGGFRRRRRRRRCLTRPRNG